MVGGTEGRNKPCLLDEILDTPLCGREVARQFSRRVLTVFELLVLSPLARCCPLDHSRNRGLKTYLGLSYCVCAKRIEKDCLCGIVSLRDG